MIHAQVSTLRVYVLLQIARFSIVTIPDSLKSSVPYNDAIRGNTGHVSLEVLVIPNGTNHYQVCVSFAEKTIMY